MDAPTLYVEDSEPEREAKRREERKRRRAERLRSGRSSQMTKRPILGDIQPVGGSHSPHGDSALRDEEGLLRPNLERFAYSSSDASISKERHGMSALAKSSVSKRPSAKSAYPGVSRLNHCVVCGTKWVVKKTASQKIAHMSKCSQRRQADLSDLERLIREATPTYDAQESTAIVVSQQNTGEESHALGAPTLMTSLMGSGNAVKGRRKAQSTVELRPADDAQASIRRKAAALFDLEAEDSEDIFNMPATQAFGQSHLSMQFRGTEERDTLSPSLAGITLNEMPHYDLGCHPQGPITSSPVLDHQDMQPECFGETSPQQPAGDPKAVTQINTKAQPSKVKKASKDTKSTPTAIESFLQNLISSDPQLHLRILRLEPLPFDDLYQKAIQSGLSEQGLGGRLKTILDEQGVNIYGIGQER